MADSTAEDRLNDSMPRSGSVFAPSISGGHETNRRDEGGASTTTVHHGSGLIRTIASGEGDPGEEFCVDPVSAEDCYQNLGRFKGARADRSIQEDTQAYWLRAGRAGATFLVKRIRSEMILETLHAVGSTLADIGLPAIDPILDELDCSPHVDQALTLLHGLGWMVHRDVKLLLNSDKAERLIALLLQSSDSDTREAAADAMLLMPPHRAIPWLKARLEVETNQDVILEIQDVLAHRNMNVTEGQ